MNEQQQEAAATAEALKVGLLRSGLKKFYHSRCRKMNFAYLVCHPCRRREAVWLQRCVLGEG